MFSGAVQLRAKPPALYGTLSFTFCHVLVSFMTTKADIRSHILQIKKKRARAQTLKFPTFTQLTGAKTRI